MKMLVLLGLMVSTLAQANFVYMQETATGKAVMLKTSEDAPATALSDVSSKDWALYPDITPDAQEVVFVEGPGQNDLHLTYKNLSKNITQRFLATNKGMILHPKFSRNGRYIFYSAPGPKGKNTVFFFDRAEEVNRQGQGLLTYSLDKALAVDDSEESYFPRPSSDGSFVVYQRNTDGRKEIVLFDRIEQTKKVIAQGMSPALSFDERYIAYTSKVNGNWDIYITNRNSGVSFRVTTDAADEMASTFMKDNTLVFASNKSGHFRLFKQVQGKWISLTQDAPEAEVEQYSPQFSGETMIRQELKTPFIGDPRSSFGTVTHQGKLYMAGGHAGAEHT